MNEGLVLTAPPQSERRFWLAAECVFGAVAVIRGCGWPNTWIATQAQLDYSQGFVKRGLYGRWISQPLHLYTLARFALVSYVFLAAVLAGLILLAWRSGLRLRIGYGEMSTVFFSSYCLTYLTHDLGYYDAPLCLLTILLLVIRSPAWRFVIGIPVCAIALLFHEEFLLIFLPVVLFSFLLDQLACKTTSSAKQPLLFGGLLAAESVSLTVFIAGRRPLSPVQVDALMQTIRARVTFPISSTFSEVMLRSFADNVRLMWICYRDPVWWFSQAASVFMFLPAIWVLWRGIVSVLASSEIRIPRWLLTCAALAAFAPLSMHLLGFDAVRWNSLVGVTTFLVLATCCFRVKGPRVRTATGFRRVCSAVIALNMAAGGSVITGRLLPYPFFNDAGFFRSVRALFHVKDPANNIGDLFIRGQVEVGQNLTIPMSAADESVARRTFQVRQNHEETPVHAA